MRRVPKRGKKRKVKKRKEKTVVGVEIRTFNLAALSFFFLEPGTSHYVCLQRCQVSLTQFPRETRSGN